MVRFGEARKRRDLVWYGEAGEARRGQVRFRLSGVGQARHDVVGQVRLVMNRRVAVDTGEAFWGMERQVWYGEARSGVSWPGAELVGSGKIGQGEVRQVGYVQKWYVQVRWVLLRRGPAGQARHGEMGRNGRGWSRVRSGKFSEEKIWIVSTRVSARTA